MYGINSNNGLYGQLYSSMFSGLYGNKQSSNSNNYVGSWNNMVPNYSAINNALLDKYVSNQYDSIKDKLNNLTKNESEVKSLTTDFKQAFGDLKSASADLKAFSGTSVFRPTGYGSTNGEVASVTSSSAASDPIQLDVKQVAQAETAASAAVNATGNTLSGKSTLKITGKDGKETVMNFDFSAAKTNQDYLKEVASAVNGKDLGITASVATKDGKSTLTFASAKTGTDSTFSVEVTGGNLAKADIKQTQKAQNATYSFNGGAEQVSQSNDVRLGDTGVGVTLKKAGSTELSKNTVDDSKTVDAVKKFAESYNKALSFLNKNSGKSQGIRDLAYSFSTTRFQSTALGKAGISVDASGALSVDAGKLTSALKSDPKAVENILGGANGIASNTYGKTVNAMNNSRKVLPQADNVSYPNYMYGRDKNFMNAYSSGIFLSSLV